MRYEKRKDNSNLLHNPVHAGGGVRRGQDRSWITRQCDIDCFPSTLCNVGINEAFIQKFRYFSFSDVPIVHVSIQSEEALIFSAFFAISTLKTYGIKTKIIRPLQY